MAKKKKVRAEFRKNRTPRTRPTDLTRQFDPQQFDVDRHAREERIGKDDLTRRRTIFAESADSQASDEILLEIDKSLCRPGRVLSVHGLLSAVESSGEVFQCATRRLLKTLGTDLRHVVAAGDRVWFRPVEGSTEKEGIIELVEPRKNVLSRSVRGRQHVIAANVDQALIVASAAEPPLKPNLIDRLLVTAEQAHVPPLVCINKIDLVDPAHLEPLVGVYARMGYDVLLASAATGLGMDRLKQRLAGRQTAIAGQSGVGKSSLLNAIEPGLGLAVAPVSRETEKGKHTTTVARLLPLSFGGYVVDTPGVRQFQLWDVIPEEVVGLFRDFRPYLNDCRFPDCTHTHEADCAVKDAVADGRLDDRRYESYLRLREEEEAGF